VISCNRSSTLATWCGLAAIGAALPLLPRGLGAAEEQPADDDLRRQVEALDARVRELEHERAAAPATPSSTGDALTWGMYGEVKFGLLRNPDANGGWQNGFDGGRLTLMPSYRLNDRILFRAEIEVEHGGIAVDDDDKLAGSVEIEQAYFDMEVGEHLHWRPPGIDLVPFGYTNLYHEPTLFYSVERPALANGLIPTTWYAGSTSIHGLLGGPFSYQLWAGASLVDDGGNVRDTTDAKTPPTPGGYPAGVDGHDAFALAHPTVGDFGQESDTIAYALRIAYSVPGARGLAGSTSVYVSPDIEPRHAYASDAAGAKIADLGTCALTMADTELRWRPEREGIELRGEAVGAYFSSPANLRANNDGDSGNNVGRTMWGASAEIAWHARWPGGGCELVPFYRFTHESLQNRGFAGHDADAPTGAGRTNIHAVGLAMFPDPRLVFKLDYQAMRDGSPSGGHEDHLLGGVGFFF
jgi:hypothetical protein